MKAESIRIVFAYRRSIERTSSQPWALCVPTSVSGRLSELMFVMPRRKQPPIGEQLWS